VVCYVDSTVALPLIGAYLMARCPAREPRRLMRRMDQLVEDLRTEYRKTDLYKRYWG
jgi:deoxyhypusine synthase